MFFPRLCLAFLAFTTAVAEDISGSKQVSDPLQSEQGTASAEPVDVGTQAVGKPDSAAHMQHTSNATEQQLESSTQVEHNAAVKMTDGSAEPEPVDIDHIADLAQEDTRNDIDDPAQEDADKQDADRATSSIEVAADGSEVDVSTRSPSTEDSVAQPETQTKSTTEILVNPSGAIVLENSAPASEPTKPKVRTGLQHARRTAIEPAATFHDSQAVSDRVLRKEPEVSTGKGDVSTGKGDAPVLRTETTPETSSLVAAKAKEAKEAKATEPEKLAEKTSTMAEIRLSSSPSQPVASRNHRIPSSRPAQSVVSTTTTVAALVVAEPEPLSWKHGLIPGVLAHLQVDEQKVIRISIGIFLAIVALGICTCRFVVSKPAENSYVQVGQQQGSMYTGLSSVDFVDGQDEGVRAMLKRIWNARKAPPMAAPTYPGGVETPTPTIIAKGQPESGMIYLDPSLF